MNEKAGLRRLMKRKLAALGAEMFENQGLEAAKRIGAELFWKKARTVLLFVSMPSEISTYFLLDEALSSGKTLFIPRIIEDDMAFFRINTLSGPWDEGPFGILEPKTDHAQQFQIEKVDFPLLVIVPGLAFNKNGHRLGRGKGYYDRFLSKIRAFSENNARNTAIMGLCLEEQLVDYIPIEEFDKKVDAVCAGNDFIEINT